ncbi:MAG: diaminopimelate epimerase [Candidatus Aminicenantia bacterium]
MKFLKAHASGNDFIVTFTEKAEEFDFSLISHKICDRHFGIGANGLVVLSNIDSLRDAVNFRIFNSDGSEAEVSGNGLKCASAFLYHKNLIKGKVITFSALAGERKCELIERKGNVFQLKVYMGIPSFSSEDVYFNDGNKYERIVDYPLTIGQRVYQITCISLGNPHCAVFFNKFPSTIEWQQIGKEIESHPFFMKKTNVELVRILNKNEIEVLFWERGVGESFSSGSGSCASALSAMLKGFVERRVKVRTRAGEQFVEWLDDGIYLTGPCEIVCEGEWFG